MKKLNEEKIMQFETVVLVMILALAVTIAWFTMSKLANVTGINAQVATVTDDFKISMTEGGAELGPNDSIIIKGDNSQLMPGGSGEFEFYLTSLKTEVKEADITLLDFLCTSRTNKPLDDEEIIDALRKHIIISMKVDNNTQKPDHSGPWRVPLIKDIPVHIKISYKWVAYLEENDLCKDSGMTESQYNNEDTMIGSKVRSMAFPIKVSSVRKTEGTNQEEEGKN